MKAEFVWHDGGRAGAGFVGHTGDCVVRALAIATGKNYRNVYDKIFDASGKTPRKGVVVSVTDQILSADGFNCVKLDPPQPFEDLSDISQGIVVVRFASVYGSTRGHLCTVVDGTIYDTWDASRDDRYVVDQYWTAPPTVGQEFAVIPSARKLSKRQQANSDAMARVVERIRKMRNTANNSASTEGEIENALRMASTMMLKYQLSEEDIREEVDETASAYGSIRLTVTGTRATAWEKSLAGYVCKLCGDVFWYFDTRSKWTEFVFYGPIDSVESAVSLFKELMLEIAVMAKLKYGGFAKGSGASYAEGFVTGLYEILTGAIDQQPGLIESNKRLTAQLKSAALQWLRSECDIRLGTSTRSSRSSFDASAAEVGKSDGRSRMVAKPGTLRIEQK